MAAKADVDKMRLSSEQIQVIFEYQIDVNKGINDSTEVVRVKFRRGKAILFTIFTGFLGGHRIYFGTHHRTPIIYSLTFGGLGILPLIDLIHIIFTKDLDKFQDKSQIIMWGK
ncbi:TM2 domain-containing protein [Vicingaceae bacterium]|nr:TM2 domain-containing protein [Vicingaceae bacterium]